MPSLSIRPADQGYDYLYNRLIQDIPPGNQFLRAQIVLPYTETSATTFLIDGNPGEVVDISINGDLITRRTILYNQNQIDLPLRKGRNLIQLKTKTDTALLLVATTNYAIFQRAYAKQYHSYIQAQVDDTESQLDSRFSLRAVEHQLAFQEMLPPGGGGARPFRILAGKLAIRSLINETGTTRGVNDIATAVSNTTPVVVPTQVNLTKFEPSVYTLYDANHDRGGFDFHVWVPNIQAAIWPAFIKLIDNLGGDHIKLKSVSDNRVVVDYNGKIEQHVFDLDDSNSDIIGIITDLLDCFFNITIVVKEKFRENYAFCYWNYPSDLIITNPLEVDDVDPLSDGWLHQSLSPPLDSGIPLDVGPSTALIDDLECFFEPMAVPLFASMTDISLKVHSSVGARLREIA